jgi:hypothetical protein
LTITATVSCACTADAPTKAIPETESANIALFIIASSLAEQRC